jgi:hypothetical protein
MKKQQIKHFTTLTILEKIVIHLIEVILAVVHTLGQANDRRVLTKVVLVFQTHFHNLLRFGRKEDQLFNQDLTYIQT